MSQLRSDAIQAIAEEVCESYGEEGPCDDHVRKAERVLDALLISLEAHTEEWIEGAHEFVLTTDSIYEGLLAALRVND